MKILPAFMLCFDHRRAGPLGLDVGSVALVAGLPPRQQGGRAFVPEFIVARQAGPSTLSSGNVLLSVTGAQAKP
jgi:hypothetical protein